MKDAKDQVWQRFEGELRRRRSTRRWAQSMAVVALAGGLAWWLGAPPEPGTPGVSAQRPPAESRALPEPARLAVLVPEAGGMRLELVDPGELAGTELSFSLEPVLYSADAWGSGLP